MAAITIIVNNVIAFAGFEYELQASVPEFLNGIETDIARYCMKNKAQMQTEIWYAFVELG